MDATIRVSPETYTLLQRRAQETQSRLETLAETAIRLQLGNTAHIEQRHTPQGVQAYLRGTRVAVRHVAAFLKAGHTTEQIIRTETPLAGAVCPTDRTRRSLYQRVRLNIDWIKVARRNYAGDL